MQFAAAGLVLLVAAGLAAAEAPAAKQPREALQAFNHFIGTWRATGHPEGTREEKQRGFWVESLDWQWQFQGDDAWLEVAFDKGKHFTKGELRYLPAGDRYRLTLRTVGKHEVSFEGALKDNRLTLERADEKTGEAQRLVLTLLHANRFLYHYEVRPAGKRLFTRAYQVGATKEGVPFAGPGDNRPECVVSGGLGTIRVTYKGKEYYVCCGGCRDAFIDEPEKYLKEYAERKAQERAGKKE